MEFCFFNVQIWGTVADWTIAIATTGSIILLFLTLRSQRKVQESQQELTRIEQFKHREIIKPIFSLHTSVYNDSSSNEEFQIIVKFAFLSKENSSYGVDFRDTQYEENTWRLSYQYIVDQYFAKNSEHSFYGTFNRMKKDQNDANYFATIKFKINFLDADFNLYSQIIDYTLLNGQNIAVAQLPKFIKKVHQGE